MAMEATHALLVPRTWEIEVIFMSYKVSCSLVLKTSYYLVHWELLPSPTRAHRQKKPPWLCYTYFAFLYPGNFLPKAQFGGWQPGGSRKWLEFNLLVEKRPTASDSPEAVGSLLLIYTNSNRFSHTHTCIRKVEAASNLACYIYTIFSPVYMHLRFFANSIFCPLNLSSFLPDLDEQ